MARYIGFAASVTLLLSLFPSTVSAGLAGNENFAYTRSIRSRSASRRSVDSSGFLSTVSFDVDDGDDVKTYMSPTGDVHKKYTLSFSGGSFSGYMPVTVFDVSGSVDCDTMGNMVVAFQQEDDVWDEKVFMSGVIYQSSSATLASVLSSCLTGHWNTTLVATNGANSASLSGLSIASVSGASVPQGPYIASMSGGSLTLTPVYRVYRDEFQAFTTPSVPDASGQTFMPLTAQVPGMATQSIPVPSRLYTLNASSASMPLAGKRIAVKDIFDIAGLKTGCGNRAYWNTYEARNASAVAIQRVIDLGGIIVGKVKTSQFANGESPTADWVDQMSPFNPRGDGYQDPSTSSAGPGSSIGAYDWVDFTIGSDSGGSVRDPAANQGVYGMRPSHGAISLEGVMPLASVLDTAGFFARDAVSFQAFGKEWYGDAFKSYSSFPKRLFVPDNYFPITANENPDNPFPVVAENPTAAQPIYDKFIGELLKFVGGYTDTRSLPEIWNATILDNVDGSPMYDYVNTIYPTLIGYYQYANFGVPWFKDYMALNDGRSPFLDPAPKVRWSYGKNQSIDGYNAAVEGKTVFMNFISEFVLKADNASCSDSLFLYPINAGSTSYRNVYKSPPGPPAGFFNEAISPFAETPEIVIPLGQVPYNSTIDSFMEYLPVSIAIIAAKNCDYVLLDLAAALQKAGIIGSVMTGRTSFPV